MNSGILNIKDEGVAQQLFLFIFHWKHLDPSIHLFICPLLPFPLHPLLKSVILWTFHWSVCGFFFASPLFNVTFEVTHHLTLPLHLCLFLSFLLQIYRELFIQPWCLKASYALQLNTCSIKRNSWVCILYVHIGASQQRIHLAWTQHKSFV